MKILEMLMSVCIVHLFTRCVCVCVSPRSRALFIVQQPFFIQPHLLQLVSQFFQIVVCLLTL